MKMRAEFRLSADFTIVIENLPDGSIEFRTLEGVDYDRPHEISDKIKRQSIVLPKGYCRAIASAMMGAAQEA